MNLELDRRDWRRKTGSLLLGDAQPWTIELVRGEAGERLRAEGGLSERRYQAR